MSQNCHKKAQKCNGLSQNCHKLSQNCLTTLLQLITKCHLNYCLKTGIKSHLIVSKMPQKVTKIPQIVTKIPSKVTKKYHNLVSLCQKAQNYQKCSAEKLYLFSELCPIIGEKCWISTSPGLHLP